MAPLLTLDAPETLDLADVVADEDFKLDMRVGTVTTRSRS